MQNLYNASTTSSFFDRTRSLCLALLMGVLGVGSAVGQTVVTIGGAVTITCPATPTATYTTPPTGVTFSNWARGSGVACASASTGLSGSTFNTASPAASYTANKFYTISITTAATHTFTLTEVAWSTAVSSPGANFTLQQINNGGTLTTFGAASQTGATSNTFTGSVVIAANTTLVLYFIPSGTGAASTTVRLSNGSKITGTATAVSTAPAITSTLTASATYGTAATTYNITASNTPTSYNATGLPPGLAVNTSTGAITGTPTDATTASYSVSISATNAGGTGTATLAYAISKAPLSITGLTGGDRTYDATTTATNNGTAAVSGLVLGDNTASVILGGTPVANYNTAAVGTGKPIIVSGYSISGTKSGNYSLSQPTGLTGNITARVLTISGISANNKVFDGTTNATLAGTPSLVNIAPGDVGVSLNSTSAAATFADAAVGTAKPVTVTGYSLTGTTAGNYTLTQPTGLTADITSAAVAPVITSALTASGTYGSVAATYTIIANNTPTSYNATGLPPGLSINTTNGQITGTPTDASGSPYSVSISATNGGGSDAKTLVYTVNKVGLTITGITASNRVYNFNNDATLSGTPTLVGVLAADAGNVTLGATPLANFAPDGAVGNGKPVTFQTGFPISGSAALNYFVTNPTTLTANITPASLTITGLTADNKVFDGTTTATLAGTAALTGVIGGDIGNVFLAGTPVANFNNNTVSNGKPVTVTGYAISGTPATNYTLSQPTGLMANITAATPVISSTLIASATYGTVAATYTIIASNTPTSFNATGLPPGLAINTTNGQITGTPTDASGSPYSVFISATNAGGTDTKTLVYTITKKALTITGLTANNKTFDGTTTATLSGTATLVGVIAADVANATLGGTPVANFNTSAIGTAKPVTVTGYTITGTAAGNYTLSQPTGLTADIQAVDFINLTAINTAVTENFDGMGGTATAATPIGFGIQTGNTSTVTLATTVALVSPATTNTGGAYNFGSAPTSDRALGFIYSGGYSGRGIVAKVRNNTGAGFSTFFVSYDVEQYRRNSTAQTFNLEYATVLTGPWTAVTGGGYTLPTGSSYAYPFTPVTMISTTYTPGGTIANGTDVYFRVILTGGSNSGGVGIDNFSISGGALCTAPTTQASAASASSLTATTATLDWTNGNGAGRVVYLSTSATNTAPATSANPAASLAFSASPQVVFNGIGASPINITGLTANTTYYLYVYEYCVAGRVYNTTPATVSFITPLALSVPTLTTTTATGVSDVAATAGGNVTLDGNATVSARGTVWATTASPTVPSANSTTDGTGTGSFASAITGLAAQTLYNYRAYATNSQGSGYGANQIFYTLASPVTTQAANLLASASSSSQLDLSWDAATFPATGATVKGYVLIGANSPQLPTFTAANGTAPAAGVGTIISTAILDPSTSFSNTVLNPSTLYNYLLVPYTWDGTNTATYNYLTVGAPTAQGQTLAGSCTPPATQASGLGTSGVTAAAANISVTQGSGGRVLVLARAASPITATPTSGVTYTASALFGTGDNLGGQTYVVYAGTTTVSFTLSSLAASTQYYLQAFTYNQATSCYQLVGPATATFTTNAPASQIETFEVASKGTYNSANITANLGIWNFNEALIGLAASDVYNGTRAARIQNAGSITTQFNKTNGLGTISLQYARFGSDANSTFRVFVSNNGGASFDAFQSSIFTASAFTFQTATIPVNLPGNQIRVRVTKISGGGQRLNIDDILLSDYTPTNTLTTGTVAGSPFCITSTVGGAVSIPFTSTGTFGSGNIYSVQLSDATGSFSNPVAIGTLASTGNTGIISATIPAATLTGSGYKVRVVSSDPVIQGTQNITDLIVYLNTPNVSGFNATIASGSILTLGWTNPLACFDEILIVGKAASSVTAIPSGNGSGYSANSIFGTGGSGANLPVNEFAVFRALSGTTVTVNGLTANTLYAFRIFTRRGTAWSDGTTITTTPNLVQIGDYRSTLTAMNWNAGTGWEQWNGTAWVIKSGAPTGTNNVTIQPGHTITLSSSATTTPIKNLIVNAGGKLFANDSIYAGNRYITVYGDITCNGTIGNGYFASGKPLYDNISFNFEGSNQTISGTGTFTASRFRKNSDATVTNLIVAQNVGLKFASGVGSSTGTVLYNGKSGSTFNVTVNENTALNLFTSIGSSGNLAIDGLDGEGTGERGGSITVNGTMRIDGSMFVFTDNATAPVVYTIGTAGVINCVNVVTGNTASSGVASGSLAGTATLRILPGGRLRLTGGEPTDVNTYNKPFSLRNNATSPFTFVAGLGSNANQIYDFRPGSYVEYASSSGTISVLTALTYANVEFTGGAISQLAGNLTASGDISIKNLGTLDPNNFNITLGGNWSNYSKTGFAVDLLNAATVQGTVNFNGTSRQRITTPGGEEFYNLTVSNSSTSGVELNSNVDLGNDLDLGTSGRLVFGSMPTNLRLQKQTAGSNTWKGSASAVIDMTGAAHNLFVGSQSPGYSGSLLPGTLSSVIYNRDQAISTNTGDQDILTGLTYNNLTLSGSDSKNLADNLTVNGELIVDAPQTVLKVTVTNKSLTLGGNLTLSGGATMDDNCRTNLDIVTIGNDAQTINGQGKSIKANLFTSVKSAGSLTLASPAGASNLNIRNDLRLDMTGTALFTDNGDTVSVGDDAELGSATSTAANYAFTGLLDFNGSSVGGDMHLSASDGVSATVARPYSILNQAGINVVNDRLEIYPVTGGSPVQINGNLSILQGTNSSELDINGNTFSLGGNWINYGAAGFDEGTAGRVVFNGTNAQTITSPGAESFYNLTWNNATGTSLSTTLNIANNLTMQAGVLVTTPDSVVLSSTATIVETDAAYVQGLVRSVRTLAQGVNETWGGIGYEVNPLGAAPGATTLRRYTGTAYVQTGFNASVGIAKYFDLNGAVNTGLNATITQYYFPHELNGLNQNLLTAYRSNDNGVTWQEFNATARNTTLGFVRIAASPGFSRWTLGSFETPLPVTLASLKAELRGKDGLLTWKTESEQNNRGFYVEKSMDGKAFRSIGYVAGAGKPSSYSLLDRDLNGLSYYRLRQVDVDGKETYSPIVSLLIGSKTVIMAAISPNPATAAASLLLEGYAGTLTLRLTALDGKVAQTLTGDLAAVQSAFRQATAGLPQGIYQVRLIGNGLAQSLRFVKQ